MDIALFIDTYGSGDINIENGTPQVDDGLETAVYLSLFCDARADDKDVLPDGGTDRRGWWGDEIMGNTIGSKLWLLGREKMLNDLNERTKQYCAEALQWLKDDGIVDKIVLDVTKTGGSSILISISLSKSGKEDTQFKYHYNWVAQEVDPVHAR